MEKTIYQKQPNLDYRSLVMVYFNGSERYLAHSFIHNGREGKYLSILYKDPLPEGDFIAGWNYLDDNSFSMVMVPEVSQELAVEDFYAAWNPDMITKGIEIIEVKGFDEINRLMADPEVNQQEFLFFGRK
ncbi:MULTISPECIES: hypothetical protein [Breznakia]|uniref:Uncharacterized protein n=1 Tax=Breznakia blatticola TaxID=1754012 RepID=A0A4R7ZC55_9FIRM|nr:MULTISPECIES: hypothetical protein [Breznakia]MDH6366959.1 hypothetical protein [Breznakia sp. PH1-1]MDH6404137.1 hypothetical protein [Breznakia sp. PF1-11]MDH6411846.1 hypothetical protein [Breznakia sp. PFB1-11]MDH6414125.1 hypothetical protein [Breznakia sp. PFB1-14]MDH6416518.1 hypothetical protein [Breznakia sp. PFB1-4]